MDFETRCLLVNRIISGYKVVSYSNDLYIIYDPSANSKYIADVYAKEIRDDLKENGILSQEETLLILESKGLWDKNKENELKILIEDESTLTKKISEYRFRSNEKKTAEQLLEVNRKRQKELTQIKNSLMVNTIEYLTKIERLKKLLYLNCYDENGNKKWKSWDDFENKEYEKGILFLLKETYLNDELDDKVLRELSRTEPWRSYWRISVKAGQLFSQPISLITDYQKYLCSWSLIYDSVYESMECPEDDVIANDDLLDLWLEEQNNKRSNKKNDNNIITNSKIANSQEVGIVVDTPEDAEKVYKLNSNLGMSIIKQREKLLSEKGRLNELDLPDIKQDLIMQMNQKTIAETKNRG